MNRIAVVIPCHNLGHTLEDAVASVLVQTRPVAEIVIVDDGSDDLATLQVLDRVAGPAVRVVHQDNQGLSAARNRGVELTTAPYVVLLDADDMLHPAYCERAAAKLDADPQLDFVSCALAAFGDADYVWTPPGCTIPEQVAFGSVHASTLFRRSLWEVVGGFDETLKVQECSDFWLSALEHGCRGTVLDEALVHYRIRSGSQYHRAITGDTYANVQRTILHKHQDVVSEQAVEILAAKEAFLHTVRRHQGHLLAQKRALEEELERSAGEDRDWGDLERLSPISCEWGLERGRPLDRHFIERFLFVNQDDIRGRVLEVKDDGYARAFGGDCLGRVDVLDVDPDNAAATIVDDLTRATAIAEASYDCFILTQTLHVIYDVQAAIAQVYRVLAPGGVVLCTLPAVSRTGGVTRTVSNGGMWRFSEQLALQLFAEHFPLEQVQVEAVGGRAACIAFLYGLAPHELDPAELETRDAESPLLVCVRAVKPVEAGPGSGGARSRGRAPAVHAGRRQLRGRGVILCYHRVADLPMDRRRLCMAPEHFRAQMAYLSHHLRPMSLEGMARAAAAGQVPDRAVAVTLDDGYLDALHGAVPVLAELGIPATFFVNTESFVEGGPRHHELWQDVLERVFFSMEELPHAFEAELGGTTVHQATRTPAERRQAFELLFGLARAGSAELRSQMTATLAEWVGRELAPRDSHRVLTAAEVQELARRPGCAIGAHTVHHLSLPACPPGTRKEEICANRDTLERVLGDPVRLFSYPYGEADPETVEAARDAGFLAAVTVEPGTVAPGDDLLALPRVEIAGGSMDRFLAAVHGLGEERGRP